jgi:hypothetical protein
VVNWLAQVLKTKSALSRGCSDLARYAAYPDTVSFQVDARRYNWPFRPVRRIQGKNRYAFPEAVLAHMISVLRQLEYPHHRLLQYLLG